jgi:hypothetical protein
MASLFLCTFWLFVSGLIFLPGTLLASHSSCAYIKSKTIGVKDLNDKSSGSVLDQGLIFPIVKPNTKDFVEILFAEQSLFVRSNKVKVIDAKYCSLRPQCFVLKKKTRGYKKPSIQSVSEDLLQPGDKLAYVASRVSPVKGKKVLWNQVRRGQDHLWVPAAFGVKEDRACQPDAVASPQKWFLMADYGYGFNASTKTYDSVLTPIPDPSNVTCLQNPLFMSVEKGQINQFNLSAYYRIRPYLGLRMGVGYEQRSYRLNALDNPHPDPGNSSCELIDTDISDLTALQRQLEEININVPLGLYYSWNIKGNHHLLVGGNYVSIFNVQKPAPLIYFTGDTLSKLTQNSLSLPINQMRDTYNLELRYIYNWPLSVDQVIGFSFLIQQHPDFTQLGVGVVL